MNATFHQFTQFPFGIDFAPTSVAPPGSRIVTMAAGNLVVSGDEQAASLAIWTRPAGGSWTQLGSVSAPPGASAPMPLAADADVFVQVLAATRLTLLTLVITPLPANSSVLRINGSSSATVLATGQVAMVDVSGGAPPSITMPPSPADGAICSVVNAAGSFATTACPVTANASQAIEDPNTPGTFSSTAGSVSLSAAGAAVDWMWDATNSRWKIR